MDRHHAPLILALLVLLTVPACGGRTPPIGPPPDRVDPRVGEYAGAFLAAEVDDLHAILAVEADETLSLVRATFGLEPDRVDRFLLVPADGGGRPGYWDIRETWDVGLRTWRVEPFVEPVVRGDVQGAAVVRAAFTQAILTAASDRSGVVLPDWLLAGAPLYVSRLGSHARLAFLFSQDDRPAAGVVGYARLSYLARIFGHRAVSRLVPELLRGTPENLALERTFGRPIGALHLEWGLDLREWLEPSADEEAALRGDDPGSNAPSVHVAEIPPVLFAEARLERSPRLEPAEALADLERILAGSPARPVRSDLAELRRARRLRDLGRRREAVTQLRLVFLPRYPESPLVPAARADLAEIHAQLAEPAVTLALLEPDFRSAEGRHGTRIRRIAWRAAEALERDGLAAEIVRIEVERSGRSSELDEALARLEKRAGETLSEAQERRVEAALRTLASSAAPDEEREVARRSVRDVGRRAIPVLTASAEKGGRLAGECVALLAAMPGDRAEAALGVLAVGPSEKAAGLATRAFLARGGDAVALEAQLRESKSTAAAREAYRDSVAGASAAVVRAVPDIAERLVSPEAEVRSALAASLGETGDAGAVPPLSRLLRDDPESGVRISALLGLGALGESGLETVEEALLDRDCPVRRAALETLLRFDEARAARHLPALAGDADPDLRATALATYAAHRARGWIDASVARLGDTDARVREIALRAIQGGEPDQTVPVLLEAYTTRGSEARDARIARLLSSLAGRDFGHEPGLTETARSVVLQRMRTWWERERGE